MGKVKVKKFRKNRVVKKLDKPPKYQSARRIIFTPVEILVESDFAYETKQ